MSEINYYAEMLFKFNEEAEDADQYLRLSGVELCRILNSGILVVDIEGQIICHIPMPSETKNIFDNKKMNSFFSERYLIQLKNIVEFKINILLDNIFPGSDKQEVCIIMPLICNMKRIGTLLLYKKREYLSDELIYVKQYATTASLIIYQKLMRAIEQGTDCLRIVRSAIGTLTYSELEAAIEIFRKLDGMEGKIIASRIAEESRITRSTIVSLLRKLESAGLIESRSLGMKGTFVKVKNGVLLEEISKL